MGTLNKKVTSYTVKITDEQSLKLEEGLKARGYKFKTVAHAKFGASHDNVSLSLFKSGKLLIQGKGTSEFVQFFLEPEIIKEIRFGYEEVLEGFTGDRIGVDESGKGDYFGPLVVA
ncbi:MAG TPA: DUF3378 domain-containing protein, partial [Proteobacteria bacterium]|nr:DUF3378 domain-containing protein [Pseudomonadota bacterium]